MPSTIVSVNGPKFLEYQHLATKGILPPELQLAFPEFEHAEHVLQRRGTVILQNNEGNPVAHMKPHPIDGYVFISGLPQ